MNDMRLGLSQRDSQAKKHASSSRVLFLISVAATFCAAFIPNTTKPCAASRLAEDNHPIVYPPQWLPVFLASSSHEAGSGLMVPGVVSLPAVVSLSSMVSLPGVVSHPAVASLPLPPSPEKGDSPPPPPCADGVVPDSYMVTLRSKPGDLHTKKDRQLSVASPSPSPSPYP